MGSLFDLSQHSCATCHKYEDCPVKDLVDIFKGKESEYKNLLSELGPQVKEYKATFRLHLHLSNSLEEALAHVMIMGYAKAKKEESIERLSKLV